GTDKDRVRAAASESRVVLPLMQGRDRRLAALGYRFFATVKHCSIGGILTCACNLWCRSSAGVGGCGKVREGFGTLAVRHHLHDMITALLELLENDRQGRRRGRVNIVKQQNASTFFLQPAHRAAHGLARGGELPVVPDAI